ncbi:hypothetical protein V8E36_003755 [Tilletia maclaganii]
MPTTAPASATNPQTTSAQQPSPPGPDPAFRIPGSRYAPFTPDCVSDGLWEVGRIMFQSQEALPITFSEARAFMGQTGKTVGPFTILYQVFGLRFNPFDKRDTDKLERAIHKLQKEAARDLWQKQLAPRIDFPPGDVGQKHLRAKDLINGTQTLKASFAGLSTSPRIFILWIHVSRDSHPTALGMQLRSLLLKTCHVHCIWAIDRGNTEAGQSLEFSGLVLAVLTMHGDPARRPTAEEWSRILPWVMVGDKACPTFFLNKPAHCTIPACRHPDVEFHPESVCPNLKCFNCLEFGHMSRRCPHPKRARDDGDDGEPDRDDTAGPRTGASSGNEPAPPAIPRNGTGHSAAAPRAGTDEALDDPKGKRKASAALTASNCGDNSDDAEEGMVPEDGPEAAGSSNKDGTGEGFNDNYRSAQPRERAAPVRRGHERRSPRKQICLARDPNLADSDDSDSRDELEESQAVGAPSTGNRTPRSPASATIVSVNTTPASSQEQTSNPAGRLTVPLTTVYRGASTMP